MTLTDIRENIVSSHIKSNELHDAIELLIGLGEFAMEKRQTGGRPAEVLRRRTDEEMMEEKLQKQEKCGSVSGKVVSEKLEKPEKGQMEDFSGFSSNADS
jgi:hypothetical protein